MMSEKLGSSYFKDLSRKDYVALASKIIHEEGVKSVSIRRIAKELGCSTAILYRYFENLDELLYYAQLDSLNEYILELSNHEKKWSNLWEIHFGIWEIYATEAFKKPEAFECIFYRNINRNLGESLQEYYEMFPNAIVQVGPLLKEMLKISNYYDRDMLICYKLVEAGEITEENAKKMNHIFCTLFLGYFKSVQEVGIEEEKVESLVKQFIGDIKEIVRIYNVNL